MPNPEPSIVDSPALDGRGGAAAALLWRRADARACVEEERLPAASRDEEELWQLEIEARLLQLVLRL